MKQTKVYRYLGANGGIVDTPVYIEGTYYITMIVLEADAGKVLTNGSQKVTQVRIPEDEIGLWKEIKAPKGQK